MQGWSWGVVVSSQHSNGGVKLHFGIIAFLFCSTPQSSPRLSFLALLPGLLMGTMKSFHSQARRQELWNKTASAPSRCRCHAPVTVSRSGQNAPVYRILSDSHESVANEPANEREALSGCIDRYLYAHKLKEEPRGTSVPFLDPSLHPRVCDTQRGEHMSSVWSPSQYLFDQCGVFFARRSFFLICLSLSYYCSILHQPIASAVELKSLSQPIITALRSQLLRIHPIPWVSHLTVLDTGFRYHSHTKHTRKHPIRSRLRQFVAL